MAPATDLVAGALSLTLDPRSGADFLSETFDRAPLCITRNEPGRFDGVLSLADAERIVTGSGVRVPAFRMVRDGAQVPLREYTQDIAWQPGVFAGLAVVEKVAALFRDGATIALQALHLHWEPAALFCRGLEIALGMPVQANAYWTPPGAQGFAVHHDTHDVFVLQLAGAKRWRVYMPRLELPLSDQKWSAELGDPGGPVMDFTLGSGDTLYLPRGWPHEAFTSDGASLHLTVGLHPASRLDAVRAALDECAREDVELRRALDPGGALPVEDLLARLAARLEPEAVAARARRRFVDGRRPIRPDALAPAWEPAIEDAVVLRPTVIAERSGATVRFEGREVIFPAVAEGALAWVMESGGPFCAGDLPGPLDARGRLVLVRRLVREGLLVAA